MKQQLKEIKDKIKNGVVLSAEDIKVYLYGFKRFDLNLIKQNVSCETKKELV